MINEKSLLSVKTLKRKFADQIVQVYKDSELGKQILNKIENKQIIPIGWRMKDNLVGEVWLIKYENCFYWISPTLTIYKLYHSALEQLFLE